MNLHLHRLWYSRKILRRVVFVLSLVIYVTLFLCLAPILGIAVNYLVLLPLIAGSFTLGILGGLLTGTLGLTSNILLLRFLNLAHYAPDNWLVAQISGILLGLVLGFLGEHFRFLGQEILKRIDTEEKLQKVLKERTLLLREIQHRVKNNLNIIHSLIGLQSTQTDDRQTIDSLEELSRRIGSMAIVHDQFSESSYVGALSMSDYIRALVVRVLDSHDCDYVRVSYELDDDDAAISLSRATPLGLLINEVISNSIKHGFSGINSPSIGIETRRDHGFYVLTIRDNGTGFSVEETARGLGLVLVDTLSRQLGAAYEFLDEEGTVIMLRIPLEERLPDLLEAGLFRT
jgi:two-component sensor histidine kinase